METCFSGVVCFLLAIFQIMSDNFHFGEGIQFALIILPEVSFKLFNGFTCICSVEFEGDLIGGCGFRMEFSQSSLSIFFTEKRSVPFIRGWVV